MRQALHILRKDARYLRNEIFFLTTFSFLFALLESQRPLWGALMSIIAVLLISLVVHAETIPGDKQFWLTRPYRWHSLLLSKLLFIFVFVNLPIFAARVLIVVLAEVPIVPALPALLVSQLWLLLAVGLPVAALAALTPGIVPFIFLFMAITALATGAFRGGLQYTYGFPAHWSAMVEWVRGAIMVGGILIASAMVFWSQYKERRTIQGRVIAGTALIVLLLIYSELPTSLGMSVQSRISPRLIEEPKLELQITPSLTRFTRGAYSGTADLELSFVLNGISPNLDVLSDAYTFSLTDGERQVMSTGPIDNRGRVFRAVGRIPAAFLSTASDKPLTLTGSVWFAVFGNAREKTIQVERTPTTVLDDLQCYGRSAFFFTCRSVSTLTSKLVTATSASGAASFRSNLSYSPLYPHLNLDPIEEDGGTALYASDRPTTEHVVTIAVKDRLAHIRRDFTLTGIRLADLQK